MDGSLSLLFGSEAVEEVLDGEIIDLIEALGSATTAQLFLAENDGICILFLEGENVVVSDIVTDSDLIGMVIRPRLPRTLTIFLIIPVTLLYSPRVHTPQCQQ